MKKVRQQEANFGGGKFPSSKKCTHLFSLSLFLPYTTIRKGD